MSTTNRRPIHLTDRWAIRIACALLWVPAIAALFVTQAKADTAGDYTAVNGPRVCAVLDDYPSDGGVLGIYQGIKGEGLTGVQAAKVIVDSVAVFCPEHQPVIDHFTGGATRSVA